MNKVKIAMFLVLVCTLACARSKPIAILKPSHASLIQQNQEIDRLGLERFENERSLAAAVGAGVLVGISPSDALSIAPSIPAHRRYVLPQTEEFLSELALEFYVEFGKPLTVDSAVRPVTVQRHLRRVNRNAAPIHGETASSHEAGCTVDLSKHLSRAQLNWLRWRLAYYQAIGWVIVEEESKCFHVMVVQFPEVEAEQDECDGLGGTQQMICLQREYK